MHFRCYNPKHEAYANYGGRGILICGAWHDYGAFVEWALSTGYADGLQIDRIDNDCGYEPDNCRWVTPKQQQSNRRDSHAPLTAFGETKTIKEWSRDPRCPVSYVSLLRRLATGRPVEWALSAPANQERRRKPHSAATRAKIAGRAVISQRQRARDADGRYL